MLGRAARRRAPAGPPRTSASQASTRCWGRVGVGRGAVQGLGHRVSFTYACDRAHSAAGGRRKGCRGLHRVARGRTDRRMSRGRAWTAPDPGAPPGRAGRLPCAGAARARSRPPGAGSRPVGSHPGAEPSVAPLGERRARARAGRRAGWPRCCLGSPGALASGRRRRAAGRGHRHRRAACCGAPARPAYAGWPTGSASSAAPRGPRPTSGPTRSAPALVLGEAVHIRGAEHYVESHTRWGCAAAPLDGPVDRGHARASSTSAARPRGCTRPSSALVVARPPG